MKRIPIYPDTKPILRGSQLFYVDPSVNNQGQTTNGGVGGSVINYPYQLPFLAHNFPVRRIRVLQPGNLTVSPPLAFGADQLLTLRKADGTYLMDRVPVIEFIQDETVFPLIRPLYFADDFFPDPRMSYLEFLDAAQTARVAIEFYYG